ncbi:MAG: hypothetical protein C4583_12720 [Anaerolineaceae bacterium]|nr:MAG: hypothetical protein C4583_12720 [Anaerolineaceae bacterium]
MNESFNLFRALLKGLAIYLLIVLLFTLPLPNLGGLSAYNSLFPGRPRLPFGENPAEAYNFSLYNLDAMFASHEIAAGPKPADEFRVLVIGDSSVWGTLLRPEETLSGQLNASAPTYCGKQARFYNLGYPTITVTKDVMMIDYAARYQPDQIIWLTSLEAFPLDKQLDTPLVANNAETIDALIEKYDLPLDPNDASLIRPDFWDRTLIGQRRNLADLLRLQLYGVQWSATGIDQIYPPYPAPQTDFADGDDKFHNLRPPLDPSALAFEILAAGMNHSPAPILLVNEPILISDGVNSHIRYNFFYPRWAYDSFRDRLKVRAEAEGWNYLDAWNIIPPSEFTNSAIHLTPAGENLLAQTILAALQPSCP